MYHHSSARFIICNIVHRCCIIFYGKSLTPYHMPILTVQMVELISKNGIINQTIFKAKEKYGFDSLIISNDVLTLIKNYINFIRPRLNPCCDYVLICRNGKQISKLSNIFGRVVFLAIGKYINPTRHRQIIETESAEKLTLDEQTCLVKIKNIHGMLRKFIIRSLDRKILP